MTDAPRFSRAEANAVIDELRRRLPAYREARAAMLEEAEVLRDRVSADGGGHDPGPAYRDAQEVVASVLRGLAERGVLLRDADPGLVDLPAERDGVPIYLCWREPEPEVAWWHPRDTGFAGRRPLED